MAIILLRADSRGKLLNALADLERYASLNIRGKPVVIVNRLADKIASSILGGKLKRRSSVAVAVNVEEDDTTSIMRVKGIHPPAHVIVVSAEYPENRLLRDYMMKAPTFRGYHPYKKG